MNKLSILAILMLGFTFNAHAADNQSAAEVLHADVEAVDVESVNVEQGKSKALRRNFISRRAYQHEVKQAPVNNAETRVESETSKRLNRRFTSKRPRMNYNFK